MFLWLSPSTCESGNDTVASDDGLRFFVWPMSEASSSVKNLEELQFFNIQSQLPGVAFTLIPQE